MLLLRPRRNQTLPRLQRTLQQQRPLRLPLFHLICTVSVAITRASRLETCVDECEDCSLTVKPLCFIVWCVYHLIELETLIRVERSVCASALL
jgi:hypothetical protein